MYSLEKAYTKTLLANEWVETDISKIRLVDLYSKYIKVWCVVHNSFYPTNEFHVLKMEDIANLASGLLITLPEFFVRIKNKALPTTEGILEIKENLVAFQDAYQAGWIPQKTSFTSAPGTKLPESHYDSAFLTHPEVEDYRKAGDYIMACVNGYWHHVYSVTQGIYIRDAIACCRKTGNNAIGLLDFSTVGKVKHLTIKPEDISTGVSPEAKLSNELYINLKEDIGERTPILVVAGYMITLDKDLMRITGPRQLNFNIGNYPLLERYEEALRCLSFTALSTLQRNQEAPTLVSVSNFFSDEVIKQIMTMPQSFIVLVENPALFKRRKFLREHPVPGYYTSYEKPKDLMFTGFGRVGVYWSRYHTLQWAMNVNEGYRHHLLMNTVEGSKSEVVDGSCETVLDDYATIGSGEISNAMLMQLGATSLKVVPNVAVP